MCTMVNEGYPFQCLSKFFNTRGTAITEGIARQHAASH